MVNLRSSLILWIPWTSPRNRCREQYDRQFSLLNCSFRCHDLCPGKYADARGGCCCFGTMRCWLNRVVCGGWVLRLLGWADTGTLWLISPRTGMASSRFCKNFGSRGGSLCERNIYQSIKTFFNSNYASPYFICFNRSKFSCFSLLFKIGTYFIL